MTEKGGVRPLLFRRRQQTAQSRLYLVAMSMREEEAKAFQLHDLFQRASRPAVTVARHAVYLQSRPLLIKVVQVLQSVSQIKDGVRMIASNLVEHGTDSAMRIGKNQYLQTIHLPVIEHIRWHIEYLGGKSMAKQDDIFQSPQAAQLLKNKDKVMGMMHSPDAKKLMELLQKSGGSGLQTAAESAMKGDPAKLMELMRQVMASPEGAATVENISQKLSK